MAIGDVVMMGSMSVGCGYCAHVTGSSSGVWKILSASPWPLLGSLFPGWRLQQMLQSLAGSIDVDASVERLLGDEAKGCA